MVATVRSGLAVVLDDEAGHSLLPSVVRYGAQHEPVVGHEAMAVAHEDPLNTIASVKRLMGTEETRPFPASRTRMTPEEMSAAVLRELLGLAAGWLSEVHKLPWLGLAASSATVGVAAVWLLAHRLTTALAWEAAIVCVLFALVYHVFVERDPVRSSQEGPAPAALMSLNMLIETPGGFDFTGRDCQGWMRAAGFHQTRVERLLGRWPRLGHRRGERPQGQAVEGRDLARHAVDVHAVDAVGGDVDVEDRLGAVGLDRVHGEPGRRQIVRETARLDVEGHELAQPAERDLHPTNCSRKRRSFS